MRAVYSRRDRNAFFANGSQYHGHELGMCIWSTLYTAPSQRVTENKILSDGMSDHPKRNRNILKQLKTFSTLSPNKMMAVRKSAQTQLERHIQARSKLTVPSVVRSYNAWSKTHPAKNYSSETKYIESFIRNKYLEQADKYIEEKIAYQQKKHEEFISQQNRDLKDFISHQKRDLQEFESEQNRNLETFKRAKLPTLEKHIA